MDGPITLILEGFLSPKGLWLVLALLWVNFVTIPVIKIILRHRPKPSMADVVVRDGKVRYVGVRPKKNRFTGLTDD